MKVSKYIKLLGVAAVAALVLSGVVASAAMANPTWDENGSPLAEGQEREMVATGVTEFYLENTAHTLAIACKTIDIEGGLALNVGGIGLDEGKLTFLTCEGLLNTCTLEPAEKIEIKTLGNTTELGYDLSAAGGKGAVADIVFPNANKEFAVFHCSGIKYLVLGEGYACLWVNPEASATSHNLVCATTVSTDPHCSAPDLDALRGDGTTVINTILTVDIFGALETKEEAMFCGESTVELLKAGENVNWSVLP